MDAVAAQRDRLRMWGALLWGALVTSLIMLVWPTGAAATTSRPNILIFLTDDQRADGSMIEMPAVRRVFGDGGTKFANGYVTTPQCCPSRSSIFSGQYAHNTGIITNDGSSFNANDTWERYLHDNGYFTGLIGKYLNGVPTDGAPYFDYTNVGRDATQPEEATLASSVREFLRLHEKNDAQPWALEVSTYSPHQPFTTMPVTPFHVPAFVPPFKPASYQEADRSDKNPSVQRRVYSDQLLQSIYNGQQLETHAADEEFAQVWQEIHAHHDGGNLLAFFLSDNGFAWGDHGLWGKGEPYIENSKVPFYVRWPGHFKAGAVDNRIAANIDIAPTIYQATGIKPNYPVDGRPLQGSYRRPWIPLEFDNPDVWLVPPWSAYLAPGKRQYIQWSDGWVEDYNLRTDPAEMNARNTPDPAIAAKIGAARACSGASCP